MSRVFEATLVLVSTSPTALFECVDGVARKLCGTASCAKPANAAWLIAAYRDCTLKLMQPGPGSLVEARALAPYSATLRIACPAASQLVEAVRTMIDIVGECSETALMLRE